MKTDPKLEIRREGMILGGVSVTTDLWLEIDGERVTAEEEEACAVLLVAMRAGASFGHRPHDRWYEWTVDDLSGASPLEAWAKYLEVTK